MLQAFPECRGPVDRDPSSPHGVLLGILAVLLRPICASLLLYTPRSTKEVPPKSLLLGELVPPNLVPHPGDLCRRHSVPHFPSEVSVGRTV